MLICNKNVRSAIGVPTPFNAGSRQITCVHSYCYLGCIINDELTVLNEFKAVYRRAERKVYMLGKLRYFVPKETALLIYKQAILPYFDYGGFLQLSCNRGQAKDLQTLQNNALRICLRYNLVDRVFEERLHTEGKIENLEQRRKYQLLKLMYRQSKNGKNVKEPTRHMRAAEKIVFNIPSRCTTRFLNSFYYIGTHTWNSLPANVQRLENMLKFENNIAPLYRLYRV